MKQKNFYIIFYLLFFYSSLFSLDLPPSFGKTHFIIGADSQELIRKSANFCTCSGCIEDMLRPTPLGIRKVFFSPDDNVLDILVQLIKKEKSSIRMAAFLLTEYNIVRAIFEARARGVNVVIVFDPKNIHSRYANLVRSLVSRGIEIYVYNPALNSAASNHSSHLSNIMHNKFIIFGDNIFERSLIWTGSFNFTYSAHRVNQENILILDDREIIKRYCDRFDHIKNSLCYRYKVKPKKVMKKLAKR